MWHSAYLVEMIVFVVLFLLTTTFVIIPILSFSPSINRKRLLRRHICFLAVNIIAGVLSLDLYLDNGPGVGSSMLVWLSLCLSIETQCGVVALIFLGYPWHFLRRCVMVCAARSHHLELDQDPWSWTKYKTYLFLGVMLLVMILPVMYAILVLRLTDI